MVIKRKDGPQRQETVLPICGNPYDGTRTPDWRSKRALRIVGSGQGVRGLKRYDDIYTRSSVRMLVREERWRVHKQRVIYGALNATAGEQSTTLDNYSRTNSSVRSKFLHLYRAWELGTTRQQNLYAASVLEAHLLAGRTDMQIASRMNMLPRMVEWYEALFFEVRQFRRADGWIALHALRPTQEEATSTSLGWGSPSWCRFLKCLGYYGGPHALDAALKLEFFRPAQQAKEKDKKPVDEVRIGMFPKVLMLYSAWRTDPFMPDSYLLADAARKLNKPWTTSEPPVNHALEKALEYFLSPEDPQYGDMPEETYSTIEEFAARWAKENGEGD